MSGHEYWRALIERGAHEGKPRGAESFREQLLIYAAATALPNGQPVLSLLEQFSEAHVVEIRRVVDELDYSEWYWPVVRRARSSKRP